MTTVAGTTNNPVGVATFGAGTTSGAQLTNNMGQNGITIQGSQVDPGQVSSGSIYPMNNTSALLGDATVRDPAAQAAAAKAAADAAQAAALRGQVQDLVNTVKSIYDGRYGQVDASAGEQAGKLNSRFQKESGQLTDQIGDQNQQAGAAYASNGTFDSSYRGNTQDSITKSGKQQIDTLGTGLQDDLGKVAAWQQQTKAGYDAGKSAMDTIVSRLADETDPSALMSLRNQIDNQIATLHGQSADNNTTAQNAGALEQIAPSAGRATQLKTTLKSIVGGTADANTKAAIGSQLIASADLNPQDQQDLLQAFHADLASADTKDQTQTA